MHHVQTLQKRIVAINCSADEAGRFPDTCFATPAALDAEEVRWPTGPGTGGSRGCGQSMEWKQITRSSLAISTEPLGRSNLNKAQLHMAA